MLNFLKKNWVVEVVILLLVAWMIITEAITDNSISKYLSWGQSARILGCWFFPILLAALWLKKEKFIYLFKRYVVYVFIFVFGVAAVTFAMFMYFGMVTCEWCVAGQWGEAFKFYYLLTVPAFNGVDVAISLLTLAVISLAAQFVKESWFGKFAAEKKMFILVLLFLWVTFLPDILLIAKAF